MKCNVVFFSFFSVFFPIDCPLISWCVFCIRNLFLIFFKDWLEEIKMLCIFWCTWVAKHRHFHLWMEVKIPHYLPFHFSNAYSLQFSHYHLFFVFLIFHSFISPAQWIQFLFTFVVNADHTNDLKEVVCWYHLFHFFSVWGILVHPHVCLSFVQREWAHQPKILTYHTPQMAYHHFRLWLDVMMPLSCQLPDLWHPMNGMNEGNKEDHAKMLQGQGAQKTISSVDYLLCIS